MHVAYDQGVRGTQAVRADKERRHVRAVSADRAVRARDARRRRRQPHLLGGLRQPRRQTGARRPRRAGLRHARRGSAGTSTRPHRVVLFDQRGCGTSTAARERPGRRHAPQHHRPPARRHGTAARAPRHRALAALRRLLGIDAAPRLRRAPPATGSRRSSSPASPRPAPRSTGSTAASAGSSPRSGNASGPPFRRPAAPTSWPRTRA